MSENQKPDQIIRDFNDETNQRAFRLIAQEKAEEKRRSDAYAKKFQELCDQGLSVGDAIKKIVDDSKKGRQLELDRSQGFDR